jgi:hypothetical protein
MFTIYQQQLSLHMRSTYWQDNVPPSCFLGVFLVSFFGAIQAYSNGGKNGNITVLVTGSHT